MKLIIVAVEECFERAGDFIPERWYSKREMIKNERAFAPFAQGLCQALPVSEASCFADFTPTQGATDAWAKTLH